ncbi:N-acetyltransferase [Pseudoflavonifractor phocaeensis]|uniref:GNAT family N-acetyltransferase n=1 Tax=Pseudoflavonifractor phocaeensis TaxID=1870988 RepID=UPI00195E65D3|nr:N-acetyltransferase [Pseudoflavonifractor phocaeensis]MBM6939716.1 N-acetyltransferase [Pseudoflavonifractor phocaeensis]
MHIRKETATDYEIVYSVVKRAFENAEHADGNEQDLVNALRKGDAFIPELSLVAEADGKIVGHIMFTRATVDGKPVLALAPLSVLPEYQRKGIGKALIQEGHKIAKELGYTHAIVLGSEKYYPKSGYSPAEGFGIKAPFDAPSENFMACVLSETDVEIHGTIKYAPEFGIE